MELLITQFNQTQSDLIWFAKGHYFDSKKELVTYLEKPTINIALKVLGISYLDIVKELAHLVALAILDSDDPIKEFQEMIYYSSASVEKRALEFPFEALPKGEFKRFVQEHTLDFLMVIIARWNIPDNYELIAPSWDPDKFKKKRKGD